MPEIMPKRAVRAITWEQRSAVAVTESPFSYKQQIHKFTGQGRVVSVELAPRDLAETREWITFFAKLNGREGTFFLSDTIGQTPALARVATVGGLVNGAGQTGDSLVSDGWPINTRILVAGQSITVDGSTYEVCADITTDGSGNATLTPLDPDISSAPPNNDPITAPGVGLVKGAGQTGASIDTDGWNVFASPATLLKSGEWFSIGDNLFSLLADVSTDGGGNATLTPIWPDIRTAPADNAQILTDFARGTFRLLEEPSFGWSPNRFFEGGSFSAVEVRSL